MNLFDKYYSAEQFGGVSALLHNKEDIAHD